jgi:hypothetical protein
MTNVGDAQNGAYYATSATLTVNDVVTDNVGPVETSTSDGQWWGSWWSTDGAGHLHVSTYQTELKNVNGAVSRPVDIEVDDGVTAPPGSYTYGDARTEDSGGVALWNGGLFQMDGPFYGKGATATAVSYEIDLGNGGAEDVEVELSNEYAADAFTTDTQALVPAFPTGRGQSGKGSGQSGKGSGNII